MLSIADVAVKIIGSLYRSRQYLFSGNFSNFTDIWVSEQTYYRILLPYLGWNGSMLTFQPWKCSDSTELFSTLQSLSHQPNVTILSTFNRYFHGKCHGELRLIVLSVQTVTAMTNTGRNIHFDKSGKIFFFVFHL